MSGDLRSGTRAGSGDPRPTNGTRSRAWSHPVETPIDRRKCSLSRYSVFLRSHRVTDVRERRSPPGGLPSMYLMIFAACALAASDPQPGPAVGSRDSVKQSTRPSGKDERESRSAAQRDLQGHRPTFDKQTIDRPTATRGHDRDLRGLRARQGTVSVRSDGAGQGADRGTGDTGSRHPQVRPNARLHDFASDSLAGRKSGLLAHPVIVQYSRLGTGTARPARLRVPGALEKRKKTRGYLSRADSSAGYGAILTTIARSPSNGSR